MNVVAFVAVMNIPQHIECSSSESATFDILFLVFLFLPLSVTADHGQEPQMGVGERHFRGGVADDSSRSSATFQRPDALNSAMKFIERIQKRVATKDAEIAKKEEEVRLLQSQRAEEMASLVAAEARLESLRAEAAPTNVVEAEFRRMQRVIDELQAELARFRSKEIRATESDEEDREMLATDSSLLAIGGAVWSPGDESGGGGKSRSSAPSSSQSGQDVPEQIRGFIFR